jgi:endonuclease YncB( thermonuclease family)
MPLHPTLHKKFQTLEDTVAHRCHAHSTTHRTRTMSTLEAKVKSVLSGDTVILHNINNPKQERTLSLAFVTAPRMRREGDEPFAFESRDFLRRLLVGKVVQFKVLYKIPTGANREYGVISLPNRTQLPEQAVAEGWLKLRDDAGRKDDSEESTALLEKLQALEARARSESKGLWTESSSKVSSSSELGDAKQFVEEHKGEDITGMRSNTAHPIFMANSNQQLSKRCSPATASFAVSCYHRPNTCRP